MPYTSHGWWVGRGSPTRPVPARVNCRGPHLCTVCAVEAHRLEEGAMQPPRLGPSPEDVQAMVAMFRVLARFGRQLGQISDASAEALEELAASGQPRPASDDQDAEAQQRANDDGRPSVD